MRSETYKMKSSVGPLLLLSLVCFCLCDIGQECLHLYRCPCRGHCRLRPERPGDKSFWTSKKALCGQCRCLSPEMAPS
uniref:CTCK domain-containing protein n=1 Tax=Anguilla anguilla TaxID=7936 RepID=A0A0E9TUL5_ANGAN